MVYEGKKNSPLRFFIAIFIYLIRQVYEDARERERENEVGNPSWRSTLIDSGAVLAREQFVEARKFSVYRYNLTRRIQPALRERRGTRQPLTAMGMGRKEIPFSLIRPARNRKVYFQSV